MDINKMFRKALAALGDFKGLVMSLLSVVVIGACSIEPPLHLAQESVEAKLPIVVTDLKVIWGMDVDLEKSWWYGWDEEDIRRWGKLEYPEPTYFEVRRYFQGETPSDKGELLDRFTIYEKSFRRHYYFGYYDLLIWSNIDSEDGTQTVLIDERDDNNIIASTTKTTVNYARVPSRVVPLKNQPDIFYNVHARDLYISRNPEDYDYFDEEEKAWVKVLNATLGPVVYVYLVQVVIYNNSNGKIVGLADNATMTNMAEGVNLNSGRTLLSNVDVVYEMRMKKGLPIPGGKVADIMGGKLTTFGLCDMESWTPTRGPQYTGSRGDLINNVQLDIKFGNSSDAVFTYDVTKQLQSKVHGGVITIEIDADTITVPSTGTTASSGFKPVVEEPDSVTHEFGI